MIHFVAWTIACVTLAVGCAGGIPVDSQGPKDRLIDNLSGDLSEINFIVENARKEYDAEGLNVRIIDAWSLAKEKQLEIIGASQAKIYTVLQNAIVEIPTLQGVVVVEITKVKGKEEKFIIVARPGKLVSFYVDAPIIAETEGYPIKLYDPGLILDAKSTEAIKQYVMLGARFEKTAKIVFKKMLEIQEKYKDAMVSIESFRVHLPPISIDIQFKVRSATL